MRRVTNAECHKPFMLSVIVLNVILLSVNLLCVVAPWFQPWHTDKIVDFLDSFKKSTLSLCPNQCDQKHVLKFVQFMKKQPKHCQNKAKIFTTKLYLKVQKYSTYKVAKNIDFFGQFFSTKKVPKDSKSSHNVQTDQKTDIQSHSIFSQEWVDHEVLVSKCSHYRQT